MAQCDNVDFQIDLKITSVNGRVLSCFVSNSPKSSLKCSPFSLPARVQHCQLWDHVFITSMKTTSHRGDMLSNNNPFLSS